jgi:hypothetical protein
MLPSFLSSPSHLMVTVPSASLSYPYTICSLQPSTLYLLSIMTMTKYCESCGEMQSPQGFRQHEAACRKRRDSHTALASHGSKQSRPTKVCSLSLMFSFALTFSNRSGASFRIFTRLSERAAHLWPVLLEKIKIRDMGEVINVMYVSSLLGAAQLMSSATGLSSTSRHVQKFTFRTPDSTWTC